MLESDNIAAKLSPITYVLCTCTYDIGTSDVSGCQQLGMKTYNKVGFQSTSR